MPQFIISWKETRLCSVEITAPTEEEAKASFMNDDYSDEIVEVDNVVFHGIVDVNKQ